MPAALTALLPFEHGPPLPGGRLIAAPLVLTAIAAAFSVAGLAALARRDIG